MVSIVGAGCGDPELITLKGLKKIQKADVIIYAGSLVNEELLKYAKTDCKFYNSAKMHLEEIIDIIKQSEKEKKYIVRLHTGDPSIYGAIQEQMDAMKRLDIEYEVIPGVSSFSGAAAALKQELTLPNITQTIILTRAEGKTPVPKSESLEDLSKHKATLILFLSIDKIEEITKKLSVGYEKNTPVAVVYKATWKEEKIIKGTLNDIAQKVKESGITKTALIIVSNCIGSKYELSKLYDKHFSTEFRNGI